MKRLPTLKDLGIEEQELVPSISEKEAPANTTKQGTVSDRKRLPTLSDLGIGESDNVREDLLPQQTDRQGSILDYAPERVEEESPERFKGLRAGMRMVQSAPYGLLAMYGDEDKREERLERHREIMSKAPGLEEFPGLTNIFSKEGWGFFRDNVSTQVAVMTYIMASAKAGAKIGSIVPGKGTVVGGIIGGTLGAIGLYQGSGYATKREMGASHEEARDASLKYDTIAGVLSVPGPLLIAGYATRTLGAAYTTSRLSNMARGAGIAISTETPAEVLAELSVLMGEEIATGRKYSPEEIKDRLTQAGLIAAGASGAMGTGAGVVRGTGTPEDVLGAFVSNDLLPNFEYVFDEDVKTSLINNLSKAENLTEENQAMIAALKEEQVSEKSVNRQIAELKRAGKKASEMTDEQAIKRIDELTSKEREGNIQAEDVLELTAIYTNKPNIRRSLDSLTEEKTPLKEQRVDLSTAKQLKKIKEQEEADRQREVREPISIEDAVKSRFNRIRELRAIENRTPQQQQELDFLKQAKDMEQVSSVYGKRVELPDVPVTEMNLRELRQVANNRGIKHKGLNRDQLEQVLIDTQETSDPRYMREEPSSETIHIRDLTENEIDQGITKANILSQSLSKDSPVHHTEINSLEGILEEGLTPGSAIDTTTTSEWGGLTVTLDASNVEKGGKVDHNDYYTSAQKGKPEWVVIDLDNLTSTEAQATALNEINSLQDRHSDVDFYFIHNDRGYKNTSPEIKLPTSKEIESQIVSLEKPFDEVSAQLEEARKGGDTGLIKRLEREYREIDNRIGNLLDQYERTISKEETAPRYMRITEGTEDFTYSELGEQLKVGGVLPKFLSKDKAKSIIDNLVKKGRVKRAEVEDSDIKNMIDSFEKDQLTREDVLELIDVSKVKMDEVVYSDKVEKSLPNKLFSMFKYEIIDSLGTQFVVENERILEGIPREKYIEAGQIGSLDISDIIPNTPPIPLSNALQSWITENVDNEKIKAPSIHSELVVDGDKADYRELVFTIPLSESQRQFKDRPWKNDMHFTDDNVGVFMRVSDRTGPNGEKVLFIEEIQSDWMQRGRKFGFTPEENVQKKTALEKRLDETKDKLNQKLAESDKGPSIDEVVDRVFSDISINEKIDYLHDLGYSRIVSGYLQVLSRDRRPLSELREKFTNALAADRVNKSTGNYPEIRAIEKEIKELQKKLREFDEFYIKSMPKTQPPMKASEQWSMLAMKRAIFEAAQDGYDQVAWADGTVHSERWGQEGLKQFYDKVLVESTDKYLGKMVGGKKGDRVKKTGFFEMNKKQIADMVLYDDWSFDTYNIDQMQSLKEFGDKKGLRVHFTTNNNLSFKTKQSIQDALTIPELLNLGKELNIKNLDRVQKDSGAWIFPVSPKMKGKHPLYKRAKKPSKKGVEKGLIQTRIQPSLKKYKGLNERVKVVNEAELPSGVKNDMKKRKLSGKVYGVTHGNDIFLIADNISSEKAADYVFLDSLVRHEGRHKVFQTILGGAEKAKVFFNKASMSMKNEVSQWLIDHKLENNIENRRTAAEEILVDKVVTGESNSFVDTIISKLMEWARKLTNKDFSLTDAELRQLIRDADSVLEGRPVHASSAYIMNPKYWMKTKSKASEQRSFKKAESLRDNGTSMADIYQQTGWYEVMPDEWYFYSKNNPITINGDFEAALSNQETTPWLLSDVIENLDSHPILKDYPELADMSVKVEYINSVDRLNKSLTNDISGTFQSGDSTIILRVPSKEFLMDVYKSNSQKIAKRITDMRSKRVEYYKDLGYSAQEAKKKVAKEGKALDEINKKNEVEYNSMVREIESTLVHEVQHAIQSLDGSSDYSLGANQGIIRRMLGTTSDTPLGKVYEFQQAYEQAMIKVENDYYKLIKTELVNLPKDIKKAIFPDATASQLNSESYWLDNLSDVILRSKLPKNKYLSDAKAMLNQIEDLAIMKSEVEHVKAMFKDDYGSMYHLELGEVMARLSSQIHKNNLISEIAEVDLGGAIDVMLEMEGNLPAGKSYQDVVIAGNLIHETASVMGRTTGIAAHSESTNAFGMPVAEIPSVVIGAGEGNYTGSFKLTMKDMFLSVSDKFRDLKKPWADDFANRLDGYYNSLEARMGMVNGPFYQTLKKIDKPIIFGGKGKKHYLKPFEDYFRNLDNKRTKEAEAIYKNAPEETKTLINEWKKIAKKTGQENLKLRTPEGEPLKVWESDMYVFDKKKNKYVKRSEAKHIIENEAKPKYKGGWRPIRTIKDGVYFPRVMRNDIKQLRVNPELDPGLYREVLDVLENWEVNGKKRFKDRAEAEKWFLSDYFAEINQNDYHANIEKARRDPLPEIFYDYSWDTAADYLYAWAKRSSQIEHYGQDIGQGEYFSRVVSKIPDTVLQNYTIQVRDKIYEAQTRDRTTQFVGTLNMAATATQLANLATAMRNLIGGTVLNIVEFGPRKMVIAYKELLSDYQNIMQHSTNLGITGKDLMNMLNDNDARNVSGLHGKMNSHMATFARWSMSRSMYKFTENIIRATAGIAAKTYLTDSLTNINNHGMNNRLAMRFVSWCKENSLNVNKLIKEDGVGSETAKLLRRAVNIPQGSYRIDMTPMWVDTRWGRFLFKYQKFSTQVTRLFYKEYMKPLMQSIKNPQYKGQVFEELVRITGFLGIGIMGGTLDAALRMKLFAYGDRGPDPEDVLYQISLDQEASIKLAWFLDRAHASLINSGLYGIASTPIQYTSNMMNQRSVMNPLDPPGVAVITNFQDFLQKLIQQKSLTKRDLIDSADQTWAMLRAYRRASNTILETVGAEFQEVQYHAKRKELSYVRKIAERWAKDNGYDTRTPTIQGVYRTEQSPLNQRIYEAIMTGRGQKARLIYQEALRKAPPQERDTIKRSAMAAIRNRQPIAFGGRANNEMKKEFLRWINDSKNMRPEGKTKIMRAQREYEKAAKMAGLM